VLRDYGFFAVSMGKIEAGIAARAPRREAGSAQFE
jgi:hypothetical protein